MHNMTKVVKATLIVSQPKCKRSIKYIVPNSGNDVNCSTNLDCPTKLGGSSFETVAARDMVAIRSIICVRHV